MVVTPSFTWRQFYNPYARRQAAVVPGAGIALTTTSTVVNDDNNNKNMGIQSQNREGAIKACKKRATQRKGKARPKYHQSAVPGGTIFISWQHCKVCKAERLLLIKGEKITIPHRAHHVRCPRNRTTRGASATKVASERDSISLMLTNRAGLNTPLGRQLNAQMPSVNFLRPYPLLNPPRRPPPAPKPRSEVVDLETNGSGFEQATQIENPPSIREVIDERIDAYKKDQNKYPYLGTCKYPMALTCAIGYIVKAFEHMKPKATQAPLPSSSDFIEAISRYHKYFPPGVCSFQFPPDIVGGNKPPSPHYHSIVGESFLYIDWKLIDPSLELYCLKCVEEGTPKTDCWLQHERTNWSKNKALFPIWTATGRPTLAVVMQYKCMKCGVILGANDGRVLAILPAAVRAIYPTDPKYSTGTFHFHLDLSDDLEALMKTYANARFVGNKLYQKLGLQYTRKVDSYLSLKPAQDYVSFLEFRRGISPPNYKAIGFYFTQACYSSLTPYGYSQVDRITREMQNVQVSNSDMIACDWTFQAIKNFNLPGAKAIFTANVGKTNEIFTLAIVASTAISQVSHMLVEILQKRENFNPKVLYHDTCPNNQDFFKALFGANIDIRLGLFHLLHRIVDTLDNKCDWYWKALVSLKKTVYKYNDDNYASLLTSLGDGSFDMKGKKYTPREIDDLRHSKRWRERCDPFLKKEIKSGPVIGQAIEEWIVEFKDKSDSMGRSLFTRNTEKIAREQVKKVQWVADPSGVPVYRKIPAGKKSKHQLPKWLSNRPESGLEKFHQFLAHMANTGSGRELADALTFAGTGDHNIKARWREHVNKAKLEGREIPGTVELEGEPPFWDHSYLYLLNRRAESLGLQPIFDFVTPPSDDNGEVFLSEYFEQQKRQNETVGCDKGTKFCNCRICREYSPIVSEVSSEISKNEPNVENPNIFERIQNSENIHSVAPTVPPNSIPMPQLPTVAPTRGLQQNPTLGWAMPFKPCFNWPPFYCIPKKQYYDNKLRGHGRAGRPPKCENRCFSHINQGW